MRRTIEIEFRAVVTKAIYVRVSRLLRRQARRLGRDDKDVFFYMLPGRLFKVVNNISRRTAAIVLKKNRIGHGSHFEEIEIPIARPDVPRAVALMDAMGASDTDHEFQTRENFVWRGVTVAMKHSRTWGYHVEFEIVIDDRRKQPAAERSIRRVAEALGVRLMTDRELSAFVRKARRSRGRRSKT